MKKLPLLPTLLALFFVVLMTVLGVWQINRAQEKEHLLTLLADDKVTLIEQFSSLKLLPKYANIEIKGHFLNQPQFLLDNQIHNKALGYHIFTPFKMENENKFIMVNRGWLAKNKYTPETVFIGPEESLQNTTIKGKLNSPPQVGIQLGEIELNDEDTQVITYFDKPKMKHFLHENLCGDLDCVVSPKVVLLDQNNAFGFVRQWKPVIMLPEKHFAYAVQWFSMTLVLIIIFFLWLRKEGKRA